MNFLEYMRGSFGVADKAGKMGRIYWDLDEMLNEGKWWDSQKGK